MAEQQSLHGGGGSTPIPDPTLLTTQQLRESIAALKEILFTRLDAMDKAIIVLHDSQEQFPTEVDRRVEALHDRIKERFNSMDVRASERLHMSEILFAGIQTQFTERDERMSAAKTASDTAVAAALQAAKEAVSAANDSFQQSINKSEAATNKQIDQLAAALLTLGNTTNEKLAASEKTLSSQIAEIGSRVTRLESQGIGRTAAVAEVRETASNTRAQGSQNMALVFGIIGAIVGVAGIVTTLIVVLSRSGG